MGNGINIDFLDRETEGYKKLQVTTFRDMNKYEKIINQYGLRERVELDNGSFQNELTNKRIWIDLGMSEEEINTLEEYCNGMGMILYNKPYQKTRFACGKELINPIKEDKHNYIPVIEKVKEDKIDLSDDQYTEISLLNKRIAEIKKGTPVKKLSLIEGRPAKIFTNKEMGVMFKNNGLKFFTGRSLEKIKELGIKNKLINDYDEIIKMEKVGTPNNYPTKKPLGVNKKK